MRRFANPLTNGNADTDKNVGDNVMSCSWHRSQRHAYCYSHPSNQIKRKLIWGALRLIVLGGTFFTTWPSCILAENDIRLWSNRCLINYIFHTNIKHKNKGYFHEDAFKVALAWRTTKGLASFEIPFNTSIFLAFHSVVTGHFFINALPKLSYLMRETVNCIHNRSLINHRLKIISLNSLCGMFSSRGVCIPIYYNHSMVHRISVAICQRMAPAPGPFHRCYELIIEIIYFCSNSYSDGPIRSQICTCHNSSTAVACANLGPDMITIITCTLTYKIWIICSQIFCKMAPCPEQRFTSNP